MSLAREICPILNNRNSKKSALQVLYGCKYKDSFHDLIAKSSSVGFSFFCVVNSKVKIPILCLSHVFDQILDRIFVEFKVNI